MRSTEPGGPLGQKFVPVCAIGASAGGITALQGLFRQLPSDLGLAYVVILHLAPDHPSALDEILSTCTRMSVLQIDDSPTLKPNCVFVIPPDRELVIDGDSVTARPFSAPRGQRAPIDMFFRSIASARGDGIAVVLSGAGADGAMGVRAVKEAGGVIMVQEPAEAGFSAMPQNAIASGVADFVAPVARLAERLVEVAHSKEAVRSLDMDGAANDLRRIVAFLRARTGHDFSGYKRATILRRVTRRMQVCRRDTLADYADYLLATPEETQALFSDFLISVTQFFRDTAAFEALERHAIKPVFDDLDPDKDEGIRAWAVGCATGEEAYSLAILLHEEVARRKLPVQLQIFASDLDEGALATAREGRYPRSIEADVSEERLARFFIDEGTHYRVRKELRDSVLFASHSVIREPPFMRLDLISCRNLMIYLERSLQQQLCSIFHYGLKPGRFLFLGSAETADAATDLFAPVDREARLYCGRPQVAHSLPVLPQFAVPDRHMSHGQAPTTRGDRAEQPTQQHMAALERSAPASALVDDGQNILHLSPSVGRFILHSGGPISNVLPAVVRPELRLDLRLALIRALDQGEATLTHPVAVALDGDRRRIAMHVTPAHDDARTAAQALVLFLDGGPVLDGEQTDVEPEARPDEVRRLHAELKAAQEALVVSKLGHEVAIQDLRAANEELQSINEEYRSTAEELETSKEELQSINEELHTVNAELKSKLASISVAHSDLQNLTAATEIGTLFLDSELRIKMFTPPITELFNITLADVGRVITNFTHQLDYDAIEQDARHVLTDLAPIEREVVSRSGFSYVMRLRPYRTVEDRIDGTVVSFVNITERLRAEAALSRSEQQLRALVQASSQVLYRMSANWAEMRELSGGGFLTDTEHPDETWLSRYIPKVDQAWVQAGIQTAIEAREVFELEHRVCRIDGTVGWMQSRAIPILDGAGDIVEWFGSATDVTERRQAEDALRESEERFREALEIETVGATFWDLRRSSMLTQSNDAFLRMIGRTREQAIGITSEALTAPEFRADSKARVTEAERTGVLLPYEKQVLRPDGTRIWLLCAGRMIKGELFEFILDVNERHRADAALRESEARQQTLIEGMPQLVWRADPDGSWSWSSPQWCTYTGQTQDQSRGFGWLDAFHPDDRDAAMAFWREAPGKGNLEMDGRICHASEGRYRWFQTRATPVRDEAGAIVEWLGTSTDVDDLRLLQARQEVLVNELQHRSRNLLGVVTAVADRTVKQGGSIKAFEERLQSLSRAQGLLSKSGSDSVEVGALVHMELVAHAEVGPPRVEVGGPEMYLTARQVQNFTLAVHELTTNAVKYGALRDGVGRLSVTWEATSDRRGRPRLALTWVESGVAIAAEKVTRRGYGTELIQEALAYALEAEVDYELGSDGVRCRIEMPIDQSE